MVIDADGFANWRIPGTPPKYILRRNGPFVTYPSGYECYQVTFGNRIQIFSDGTISKEWIAKE